MSDDRACLERLIGALYASSRSLHRDECSNWMLGGKSGHVYADGDSFMLYCTTGQSTRRWKHIKRSLSFCRVTQDGDDEGYLRLDRLPTADEATVIRDALGIRKRRHVTDEQQALLVERGRALYKRRVQAKLLAETGDEVSLVPDDPKDDVVRLEAVNG